MFKEVIAANVVMGEKKTFPPDKHEVVPVVKSAVKSAVARANARRSKYRDEEWSCKEGEKIKEETAGKKTKAIESVCEKRKQGGEKQIGPTPKKRKYRDLFDTDFAE